jgi:hypothetical protein
MMRGQIEEQRGNAAAARELYNKGVSLAKYCLEFTCSYKIFSKSAQEEPQLHFTMVASFSP